MSKLRLTIVVEYDADPEYYDTTDPAAMAEIDSSNWDEFGLSMLWTVEDNWDDVVIKVEPVD